MGTYGIITEIKRFATHDGPGIRTTIFCKGCPLRCKWCSNPETQNEGVELYFIRRRCSDYGNCVSACPVQAISMDREHKVDREKCTLCFECVDSCPNGAFQKIGQRITVEEAFKEVLKDEVFYGDTGGLTLSGGEPLYQPDFIIPLLKLCRERGISTVLDTSGFAPVEVVKDVARFTDMVLFDIKHMDPVLHEEGVGVDNNLILENAAIFSRYAELRISFPLIPGYNDDEKNIREMAEFACSLGVRHVDINPLHILGSDKYRALDRPVPYDDFRRPSSDEIEKVVSMLRRFGMKTTVGRMF